MGLTSDNKSKTDGWSKSGLLFTKNTKLVPNPAQGPGPILPPVAITTDDELSFQVNFPRAEYYTVQFGIVQDPTLIAKPDVTGEVTWTVEGNSVRRLISVGNGTSISGTGAACTVKLRDTTLSPATPAGLEYVGSILFSKGTRPARSHPPFLRATFPLPMPYFVIVPAASFITVPIPTNAGVVSSDVEVVASLGFGFPLDVSSVTVSQVNAALVESFKAYYPLIETGFVPIFPSATDLVITNLNPVIDISVSILWGIDG